MGGWLALDQITTQEIRTRGTNWEPLQTISPSAEPRQINTFAQTLLVDYKTPRMRTITPPACSLRICPGKGLFS
jgi:hypothetical protein